MLIVCYFKVHFYSTKKCSFNQKCRVYSTFLFRNLKLLNKTFYCSETTTCVQYFRKEARRTPPNYKKRRFPKCNATIRLKLPLTLIQLSGTQERISGPFTSAHLTKGKTQKCMSSWGACGFRSGLEPLVDLCGRNSWLSGVWRTWKPSFLVGICGL